MSMFNLVALLRRLPDLLARLLEGVVRAADDLVEDAPGFWRRHKARVLILVISAVASGAVTFFSGRMQGPF
jgi:hypothetical protein